MREDKLYYSDRMVIRDRANEGNGIIRNFIEMARGVTKQEIREIFESQIHEWFQDTARQDGTALDSFCEAFKEGNATTKGLKEPNPSVCFYHGILLVLLAYKENWIVLSNQEAVEGYSDILVEVEDEDIGIIIEIKYVENADFEAGCREAMNQIENKNYEGKLV